MEMRNKLVQICNLVNMSHPFVMIACTSTFQTDVLRLSGQPCITLTPPAILEPDEFGSVYQALGKYEDSLIVKMMVQDMNGHGRALEYLMEMLRDSKLDAFKPNSIMNDVKSRLKVVYHGWTLVAAIIRGRKLFLTTALFLARVSM